MPSHILIIGNYASVKNCTFALEHLPDNIDWGTRRTLNNSSSLLCYGSNQTPITVWFVGRVLEFNHEKNGLPNDMVGISVDSLMQGTANEAQKLLSKLCMPITSTFSNKTSHSTTNKDLRIYRFVERHHRHMLSRNLS